jgi:hypothetical protein
MLQMIYIKLEYSPLNYATLSRKVHAMQLLGVEEAMLDKERIELLKRVVHLPIGLEEGWQKLVSSKLHLKFDLKKNPKQCSWRPGWRVFIFN